MRKISWDQGKDGSTWDYGIVGIEPNFLTSELLVLLKY